MAKKSFSRGLDSLLGEPKQAEPTVEPTAPKAVKREITKSSQKGTKENETRATFIVNEDYLEKMKSVAYWDRVLIKDIVNSALEDYILRYEKKNGAIKEQPKK